MDEKQMEQLLMEKRMLLLGGPILEKKVNELREQIITLNLKGEEEIKLVICSEGGDSDPSLWLFDMIKSSKAPITGIINGECASMALVVLQACQKRLSTKHSMFFTHMLSLTITFSLYDDFKEKIKRRVKKAQENQIHIENILIQRTGKSHDEIMKLIEEGEKYKTPISAQKAKKLNFIDKVIDKIDLF